jgi:hypothetical protein
MFMLHTELRRYRRWHALLVGMVVLFAFLATSFVASNSAVWLHLAAGRLLAQGQWPYSAAPFHDAEPAPAPWLFDLGLYALYRLGGGAGILVVKAGLIAALAALLFRRLCTLDALPAFAALVAVNPYLELRPALLSYLFVGLTLWLLERSRYAPLPLLFALWANLDRGFWFGPLLATLLWVGQWLDGFWPGAGRGEEEPRRVPLWLPLTGWVACLLNPWGMGALALPAELLPHPWWSASVWQAERIEAALRQGNLAVLAYFALVGLGLFSFVLPGLRQRGRRGVPWFALALLSIWQSAWTPFFAIASAPLLALNVQDFASRAGRIVAGEAKRKRFPWPLLGRLGLLFLGLLILLLAASDGLRGWPRGERLLGWDLQADPAAQRLAETVWHGRRDGWLRPEERILVLSPCLVHYFAWFCPEEDLAGAAASASTAATARRATGAVYAMTDNSELFRQLATDPQHWLLLDVQGRFTFWAWKEACSPQAAHNAFDANQVAFGADAGDDRGLPPAPDRGPKATAFPRGAWERGGWLDGCLRRALSPSMQSEAATTFLRYFQERVLPHHQRQGFQRWCAYAGNLVAPPPPTAVALVARLGQPPVFPGDEDRDLPAWPLLAIRAARLALASNPDDANTYLRLGQAYQALWASSGERTLSSTNPLLAELRYVQTVTALEQAIQLDPEQAAVHRLLAALYQEHGYLDAALEHRRHEVRLAQRAGKLLSGVDRQNFERQLARLHQRTEQLERLVHQRQQQFASLASSAKGADVRELAQIALRLGLARLAVEELLLPTPTLLLESNGLQMELQLLLRLGRTEQLREALWDAEMEAHHANLGWLNIPAPPLPGYPRLYRLPAASWFRFLWAASTGDYELAERQQHNIVEQVREQRQEQLRSLRRSLSLALAADLALSAQPSLLFLRLWANNDLERSKQLLALRLPFHGDEADLHALGGMLFLERGFPQQAEHSFALALRLCQPSAEGERPFALRGLAEFYLRRLSTAGGREQR